MTIREFGLERYFAEHEFKVRHVLSASDCESLSMAELLGMASPEALAVWRDLRLSYTESQGHPRLRTAIAELYGSVAPDGVVVAAPEEAIFVVMHALLEPGDRVVVQTPAYQSLHEVARSIGCEVVTWRLASDRRGWGLDIDALGRLVDERTRMVVVNFPHNPTGAQATRAQLDAIVALTGARGAWLFSDEMYRLLEHEPGDRLPAVADLYERGISLSGLSKAFGLPGLRIGWLASRAPGLAARVVAFKDYTTICSSAPSEALAVAALGARARILARNLAIVRGNVAAASRFFAAHSGRFEWLPARSGSVAFPRWTGPGTVDELCRGLLDRKGVMLVPGSLFDAAHHVRIGLGRRDLPEGLALLGEYLFALG
ncbi:MAG TPA: aminotransferase class I/II-fold pyridoxal phosphate-dependent enzyme [Thermoanaerobaculaceae bacterium]|nr:aminotransferase class I/II-fold pyridoxal phosphate-dependent enzyme [Thermoanaerobaculaceae bacterium]